MILPSTIRSIGTEVVQLIQWLWQELRDLGLIPEGHKNFFSSPPHTDCQWVPPSLLSNRYRRPFPRGKSDRNVKLNTHLQCREK